MLRVIGRERGFGISKWLIIFWIIAGVVKVLLAISVTE